ncbi:hypothetical protein [Nocardia salmonicida]
MSPVADHGQRFRAELGGDHLLDRLDVLPGRPHGMHWEYRDGPPRRRSG